MGFAVPHRREESADAAMEKMNSMPDQDWSEKNVVVRETAHGSPYPEIVKYAKDNDIDVIAIGTHGRTGLSHVLMGSVAENVVRHAPCPVLIIRKEGHQFVSP